MNYIFYHIYMYDKIDSMIIEQLNRLVNSKLLEISELHVTILNNPNYSKLLDNKTLELLTKLSKSISYESGDVYEIITHKKIYDHAYVNNGNYLYMHTKGCTRINDLDSGDYSYKNVENWRHMQEYFTIDKYDECLEGLKTYDVVGSNYMQYPNYLNVPAHYSGGFWWSKSEFIKNLPNPQLYLNFKNVDRFNAEFWLGRIYHKALCLYEIPKPNNKPYAQHRGFSYCDKSVYENNIKKNTYINKL